MKPMKNRWVSCVGWLGLAALSACAQGSPSKPPGANDFDSQPTVQAPVCGNGKFDANLEQCDCQSKTATTQCVALELTCPMVIPGSTGMLLCNAQPLCTLDTKGCVGGTAPPRSGAGPGTGGGGTGRF